MAVEAIYNPTIEEAGSEPVQPTVKEWAKGAFEQIAKHTREFVKPSLEKIDQIRAEMSQRRGLARINYQIGSERLETSDDKDFIEELSQQIETAKGDTAFLKQEQEIIKANIIAREAKIEQLLQERERWTGGS